MTPELIEALEQYSYKMLQWPANHLCAVGEITTATARDGRNHHFELVHGNRADCLSRR